MLQCFLRKHEPQRNRDFGSSTQICNSTAMHFQRSRPRARCRVEKKTHANKNRESTRTLEEPGWSSRSICQRQREQRLRGRDRLHHE